MLILLLVLVLAAGTVAHIMLVNAEADNLPVSSVDTNATSDVVNKTEKEFKPVEASLAIAGLLAVCFLVLRQRN